MIASFNKFTGISKSEKILFIKAYFYCFISRLIILFIPVKRYSSMLGMQNTESNISISAEHERIANLVKIAIWRVNKYAFWKNNCFAQASGAKKILSKFNISSTLYLGVKKDVNNHLIAHAWLRCGSNIITGKKGYKQFTVVSTFA